MRRVAKCYSQHPAHHPSSQHRDPSPVIIKRNDPYARPPFMQNDIAPTPDIRGKNLPRYITKTSADIRPLTINIGEANAYYQHIRQHSHHTNTPSNVLPSNLQQASQQSTPSNVAKRRTPLGPRHINQPSVESILHSSRASKARIARTITPRSAKRGHESEISVNRLQGPAEIDGDSGRRRWATQPEGGHPVRKVARRIADEWEKSREAQVWDV
jgi:hypothetical protein